MAEQEGTVTLYNSTIISDPNANPFSFKAGIAQSMLRGGAIFHVSSPPQAKLAEQAGACAVLASPPRHHHGIPRMIDPSLLKDIKHAVSIPVISNVRVGHFVEAQILQSLGVDYIDESEVFGLADDKNFINKHNFRCPFVCGVKDLGEAVRRIREGAAMIRTKGDFSNSGNIVETVRNVRCVKGQIRKLSNMDDDEVFAYAKEIEAPYDLVAQIKAMGRLPVVHFAAGGIVTPADVAMMMQLGCDGVFVGPDVFDCGDPYKRARGIVEAVTNYSDPDVLARCCHGLNEAMADLSVRENNDRIEHFGGSTA